MRALDAIYAGADLAEESKKLADEFTDRHTASLAEWWRGLLRHGPRRG